MGHYQSTDDSQIVQSFQITRGNCHGSPVYWNGPRGPQVYIWPEYAHLMAFRVHGGRLDTTPASESALSVPDGMPGAVLSVSAEGNKAGTGIVWSSAPYDANANWETVPGVLRAYDASDLGHELWNSRMNPVSRQQRPVRQVLRPHSGQRSRVSLHVRQSAWGVRPARRGPRLPCAGPRPCPGRLPPPPPSR